MKAKRGVTLLDLIISIVIATIVLFAASRLLINFGNFSFNFVKSEASLVGTAVGAFEEITGKITEANKVVIPTAALPSASMDVPPVPFPAGCSPNESCIQIRVDESNTAADYSDDKVYNYWFSGNKIYKSIVTAASSSASAAIADDITVLNFSVDGTSKNKVQINVEAKAKSGSVDTPSTEKLQTTAIMRSRSAQT